MAKRIVIRKLDILTLLTAGIFLLGIPYIYHLVNLRVVKAAWTALVLFSDCIYILRHGIALRAEHGLLLLAAAVVMLTTAIHGGSMLSCLSSLSAVVAVCFLIVFCREKHQIIRMCRLWCGIFFLLLLIDTFTMIVWPKGLYTGTYPRNNFFLGYKTARLVYTFTLLLFYNYAELLEKKDITLRSYVLAILVLVNALLSNSSGSLLILLVYSFLLFFSFGHKKNKFSRGVQKLTRKLISKRFLVFAVWLLCFIFCVFAYNTPIVQNAIGRFGKVFSFGERTVAWANAIEIIKGNWLIGIGVQSRDSTLQMTDGFANTHNMVFTYLMTGGLIGLLLLTAVIISALRRSHTHPANYAVTVFLYCVLFLGIFSSALAFDPFFFAALLLPLKDYDKNLPESVPVPGNR